MMTDAAAPATPLVAPVRPERLAGEDLLRRRLAWLRWKAVDNTDKYLIAFEANMIRRGVRVSWARHAADAEAELKAIIARHGSPAVPQAGPLCRELGLAAEPSAGSPPFVLLEADYAMADPGGLFFYGRPRLGDGPAAVLVAVDRLLPAVQDLSTLLSCPAPGIRNGDWWTVFAPSGTHPLYVIVVDNGRSDVMAHPAVREVMRCVRCSGCADRAQATGAADRPLPHEAVSMPYAGGFRQHIAGSFEEPADSGLRHGCPVMIDFKKLLLINRRRAAEHNLSVRPRLFYFLWKTAVLRRGLIGSSGRTLPYFTHVLFNKSEKGLRTECAAARKPFNRLWRERMHIN